MMCILSPEEKAMDIIILTALGIAATAFIILRRWVESRRYGKFQPSDEITAAFESFRVEKNKRYYLSGPDNYPHAIIGIEKEWRLETDLWKQRDLSEQTMKELVQNMHSRALERNLTLYGFSILDDRDRNIGVWYSIMGLNMTVEIRGEYSVDIHTPPIDTYGVN